MLIKSLIIMKFRNDQHRNIFLKEAKKQSLDELLLEIHIMQLF